ncbi:MAG TPA: rhamnulokinase [Verrucomicrobia bacterium]|nr:rhamnulokinase [Verrucomicrobiota bacterium]HOB32054.1 rhamnulokinase family protein [Verrucomicrobiota bacterium]HOP98269.1 rhamnulokinase family protein [Verrucomicrobiota bacterium]HPU55301.1 rhamnulokinase family protein [Verrucomicrobiota bacterium]
MSQQVYLGIDIGAESGRVMAGHWDGKRVQLEELHRFPNGGVWMNEALRWNTLGLWAEILAGLSIAAKRFGSAIVSVGVDTWGVDFALISKSGELLGLPVHYRDARTRGIFARAFAKVPREEIFAATGLQFMELNTLFQLIALQKTSPELLAAADTLLLTPDFLHFCLCGARASEFTIATTSQCVNPKKRAWATDLLQKFGLPERIFPEIVPPGSRLGLLRPSLADRTGLNRIHVVAPAAHDTGSAVAGVPSPSTGKCNWAYLSSGTWSLLGVEVQDALLSPRVLELNFTNEGGIDGTYRLLKNIMGLWLVQQCRRAFREKGNDLDYETLVRLAAEAPPFRSLVDPDDSRFLNPPDMPAAIQEFCRETDQPVPETEGQLIRCVLESLALTYAAVLDGLEQLTGVKIDTLHIVGGGSRNQLLNQFTANAANRPVLAGPVEATVLGNVLVQVRSHGELKSLADIRAVVRGSTEVVEFQPQDVSAWAAVRERFAKLRR